MLDPLLSAKLTYILGITNLIGLGLVFFSCRCFVGYRFVEAMMRRPWYRVFYNKHCIWWYVFFVSVFFHSIIAILTYGFPLL
ncbi:MAG: hypothetical protein A2785_00690 [Candidatus Chisholmbacteria bacterium RIFCSPHIGHO2_01_FULL_49_18]|uniref:Ferric oxidoreductase domain-containing protein n=2 Tax=Candidatus Chisholmiibacteriota TaxID=1817900 RepID=A0A1G1VNZ3_9BACT|nr:MAG: hypothetical protein A2785_00690 [Candidatus Chisholmbacteria bacterium RIFCSPHIGHO2_01_FULL_49_18]OGY21159.1 MAG: hypothetical protein A3A65_03685 [Candidatus Chisholmbacteria bacterium RIFCSPLOWO2_01_FULL_49_14]